MNLNRIALSRYEHTHTHTHVPSELMVLHKIMDRRTNIVGCCGCCGCCLSRHIDVVNVSLIDVAYKCVCTIPNAAAAAAADCYATCLLISFFVHQNHVQPAGQCCCGARVGRGAQQLPVRLSTTPPPAAARLFVIYMRIYVIRVTMFAMFTHHNYIYIYICSQPWTYRITRGRHYLT